MVRFLILAAILGGWTMSPSHVRADDGKFQLMKATENRVWRLNKQTGEIAVCTLEAERLLCTTSSEAATPPPPKKSYAEIKAEKDAAEKADRERQRKQDEIEMKILDRILAFFRELITMTKEQNAAK